MPLGFCNPPMCWMLTYNFNAAALLVMRPKDVPQWNKGFAPGAGQFQQQANAFKAQLNAQANVACGGNCVCVRLHPNALNVNLAPQRIGPHPNVPGLDLYMTGINMTGWFGICAMKGAMKIKKGGKWIPVEDLGPKDTLNPPSSSGSPGGKKKGGKGKKKKKATRSSGSRPPRRRR